MRLGEERLEHPLGRFDVHFFRDLAHETTAMAVSKGDLGSGAPLLARVHSACVTSECLMGCDCDCAEQLDRALTTIARQGRGVVFYLMQEGRGAGLTAKARDRMIVQASGNRITTFEAYASMGLPPDLRRYDVVAPMARLLEIRAPIRLLTNNPEKAADVARALESEKIVLAGTAPLEGPISVFNRDYLSAKHDSGHALARPGLRAGASPPGRVRVFDPIRLADRPHEILTASYFLPIALPPSSSDAARAVGARVEWFRASVLYDRERERESIVLAAPSEEGGLGVERGDVVRTITMRLFDRLPGAHSRARVELADALDRACRRGDRDGAGGSVLVRFDDRDHAPA